MHPPRHKRVKSRLLQPRQAAPSFFGQQAGSRLPAASQLVPKCANCAGINPFVNPADPTHNGRPDFIARKKGPNGLAGFGGGQPAFRPQQQQQQVGQQVGQARSVYSTVQQQALVPQQPSYRPQQQQQVVAGSYQTNYNTQQVQQNNRQFPKGKLNLNRFDTGFNFDFSS